MDWSLVLIAAPFVLLVGALIFHAGGWRARLLHVLEHGHAVDPPAAPVTDVEHKI